MSSCCSSSSYYQPNFDVGSNFGVPNTPTNDRDDDSFEFHNQNASLTWSNRAYDGEGCHDESISSALWFYPMLVVMSLLFCILLLCCWPISTTSRSPYRWDEEGQVDDDGRDEQVVDGTEARRAQIDRMLVKRRLTVVLKSEPDPKCLNDEEASDLNDEDQTVETRTTVTERSEEDDDSEEDIETGGAYSQDDVATSSVTTDVSRNKLFDAQGVAVIPTISYRAGMPCEICLTDYEMGDVIGSSSSKGGCEHSFHAECISRWLMRNQTCPLCRSDYMPLSRPSEGRVTVDINLQDGGAGHTAAATVDNDQSNEEQGHNPEASEQANIDDWNSLADASTWR